MMITTMTFMLVHHQEIETGTNREADLGVRDEDRMIETAGTEMSGEEEIRAEDNDKDRDPLPLHDLKGRNQDLRKRRKSHKLTNTFSAKNL